MEFLTHFQIVEKKLNSNLYQTPCASYVGQDVSEILCHLLEKCLLTYLETSKEPLFEQRWQIHWIVQQSWGVRKCWAGGYWCFPPESRRRSSGAADDMRILSWYREFLNARKNSRDKKYLKYIPQKCDMKFWKDLLTQSILPLTLNSLMFKLTWTVCGWSYRKKFLPILSDSERNSWRMNLMEGGVGRGEVR